MAERVILAIGPYPAPMPVTDMPLVSGDRKGAIILRG
jgi:hypothetical protein